MWHVQMHSCFFSDCSGSSCSPVAEQYLVSASICAVFMHYGCTSPILVCTFREIQINLFVGSHWQNLFHILDIVKMTLENHFIRTDELPLELCWLSLRPTQFLLFFSGVQNIGWIAFSRTSLGRIWKVEGHKVELHFRSNVLEGQIPEGRKS